MKSYVRCLLSYTNASGVWLLTNLGIVYDLLPVLFVNSPDYHSSRNRFELRSGFRLAFFQGGLSSRLR